jgi:Flp pilus assembly protein TadG
MIKRKSVRTRDRRGERGTVLAASALGMLSFLLAVGLGLDISHMYLAKTELQNAADAAALAGASGLDCSSAGIGRATNRAKAEMNKYEFDNTNIGLTAVNVRFGKNLSDFTNGTDMDSVAAASAVNAPTIKFVKVTTPDKPINIAFVSMVLGSTVDLKADAIAGMSVPLTSYEGYLPVSVVDDDSLSTIKPGQLYTFRGSPQGSVSPGNYQILAIDGSGAADDRIGLATGVKNVVGPGGYVDTKPGVSAGAVRQGINTRFDDYASGMNPVDYPPDTNIKEGISYADYQAGTPSQPPKAGHNGVYGRRVVLIPIIKKSQFAGGRTNVQIDHFGAFFLRSKVQGGNGGDIQAEYIGVGVVVGSGEYDPDAPPTPGPAITKPVLYR